MPPGIVVTTSSEMNNSDVVTINGKEYVFSFDDCNNTDRDLIVLYMYQLSKYSNHGIKVGMTQCKKGTTFRKAIESRVKAQTTELALPPEQYEKYGLEREIVYWGICLDAHSDCFKDYYVHERIMVKMAGIHEKDQEWFHNVSLDQLIVLFQECRSEGEKKVIYTPRKEQRECIDALKSYFSKKPNGGRFLMNCKMRFGKSFVAYKYCEEANLNRILILTFVPAVQSTWFEDLAHISKEYLYLTDRNLHESTFQPAEVSDPFVMFLSLQNYLGKDVETGETKDRLKKIQSIEWDLVIFDEYHFGAWNDNTRSTIVTGDEFELDYLKDRKRVKKVMKQIETHAHRTLCLSGTPFKSLQNHEFGDAVYSYTYFDEQKNKYPNFAINDFKTIDEQYTDFPDMKICGYDMTCMFGRMEGVYVKNANAKRYLFSLNKFFETRAGTGTFINEEAVRSWLEIIKGAVPQEEAIFPYDLCNEMRSYCQHSLWLMPSVESVGAMARLLRQDRFFSRYEIIDMSEANAGVGLDAYRYLTTGMNRADNNHKDGSITITVNKLTLGVTVKPWSAVFVLKDLSSPESYFQSIFRVQTPYHNGSYIKKYGYVFDFNIDRAALLLMQFAAETENMSGSVSATKAKIAKMIVKFLPIYLNGNMTNPIDEEIFYSLAELGDPHGKPLSKKIADTSMTTRIGDGETLALMMEDPDVKRIMDKVFSHSKIDKKNKNGRKDKTNRIPPVPDDYDPEVTPIGRDLGYKAGLKDYDMLSRIMDDTVFEQTFMDRQKELAEDNCPKEFKTKKKYPIYYNAFVKGYESGVNIPVKKLNCGKENGKEFIKTIKKELGSNIKWTRETSVTIRNIINNYLNDENNIPEEYRSALYKMWYHRSFTAAIKNDLRPEKDVPPGTVESADNVIRHILSRLFEFLYISVYRETTFEEIFNNANPDMFLEAVGITKEEFLVLNKYHIFEENTLNNCIRDFFVNESLGSSLDMSKTENRKKYRNSFDWYGFGVEDLD